MPPSQSSGDRVSRVAGRSGGRVSGMSARGRLDRSSGRFRPGSCQGYRVLVTAMVVPCSFVHAAPDPGGRPIDVRRSFGDCDDRARGDTDADTGRCRPDCQPRSCRSATRSTFLELWHLAARAARTPSLPRRASTRGHATARHSAIDATEVRGTPVQIDKAEIVSALRSRGLHARADWVDRELPDVVDTYKNGALLQMLGVDPDTISPANPRS